MGNSYLEKPITTKKSNWAESRLYKYATCEMQGWRKNMEDAYIAELEVPGFDHIALFGVFDGHGGAEVSRFVSTHFVEIFSKRKSLA
jgi:serine/threonine protein phosphatase PrpC